MRALVFLCVPFSVSQRGETEREGSMGEGWREGEREGKRDESRKVTTKWEENG